MNSIESAICESISLIVDKAISEAGYDKTIQGTIVSVVDSTIGSYRVSYQDSTFLAYSTNTDVTYTTGSTVYVLIPSGNFSKDKTILGTVKKLGINYVSTAEGQEAYDINGVSVVTSTDTFELSSYYPETYAKVLYSKDNDEKDNLIKIDKIAIEQYIKTSKSLICGMTVKTKIPVENQYSGNYGIIFALNFVSNSTSETITRYYTVDVDKMTGNPYKLITATEQYGIFDIDSENFIEINYISLFSYGFPNTKDYKTIEEKNLYDIFISDITMCGAVALSSEDLASYSLTFSTPQGTYFTSSNLDSDVITLQAQVRVKGKVIDNDSQSLSYYWFIEHAGINSQSLLYNKYGGQGWKCLNDYSIINEENGVVEWVGGKYQFTIAKSDVIAASATYKCAVVYDGTVLSNTITVKNLGSNYTISIESDLGEQFYFDIGNPTLTCYVNGEENISGYTYSWSETTYDGVYSALSETSALNDSYEKLLEKYNTLLTEIESGKKVYSLYANEVANYKAALAEYDTLQRVKSNKIYKVDISSIITFSTYTCTVYYGTLYLGTTSITLVNSLTANGCVLRINNGSYTYKYDENGISPASASQDSPIDIQALSFTVLDDFGNDITESIIKYCTGNFESNTNYIKWTIPVVDTMLNADDSYNNEDKIAAGEVEELSETTNYYNLSSFAYTIDDRYTITYNNNNIVLEIKRHNNSDGTDLILTAQTSLTFIKEGESGTNGTNYTCKIVPNIAYGTAPNYPMITEYSDGTWELNYLTKNANVWFKAQLWNSEVCILESPTTTTSDEGVEATITWSVLQNKYTAYTYDPSSLEVLNESAGTFNYTGYKYIDDGRYLSNANIVKVTIKYDGMYYYATLPIVVVKITDNNYSIYLKNDTGFKYATYTSDGQSPKYDNAHPFEITVLKYNGKGDYDDESSWDDQNAGYSNEDNLYINEDLIYTWNYLGQVYEDKWVDSINLTDGITTEDLQRNQWVVRPLSDFDGQCVTNAVECVVKDTGAEVARIHMPIHLLLNRYGLAALNDWDGNSITIDEDGGYILAPQVGAGIKNSDNSFTGVVIGAVKESGSSTTEVGLFGYAAGVRSIFLDADSGKAEFGAAGKGQIVIDPSSNKAQLYSGNYSTSAGTGMLIDLTTPEIKYGSGNFSVDANGYLTAKGGGSIAGFNIDDDSLYTGSKSSSTNVRISSADFQRTVNGTSDTTMRMAFSNNFGVNSSGKMYAASGIIGSGSNKITLGKSSGSDSYSAIYSGSKSSFDTSANGFYIGTDGIALGSYSSGHSRFQVTNAGQMIATTGYIGNGSNGWSIQSNYLVNGDKTSYNDTGNSGVYIGTQGIGLGSSFYVSRSGDLHSSSGTIGGWTIGSTYLKATDGTLTLNASGSISGGTSYSWSINSAGTATFNRLVASSSGTIGGWTIGSSTLTGGKVSLNSNGSLVGPTWSITSDGVATFTNVYITNDSSVNTSMNWGNFAVDTSGNLNATNAKISGSITASSISGTTISGGSISGSSISGGTISGTTISGSVLDLTNGNIKVDSSTYGKSDSITYVNSVTITDKGYVEIDGVQYSVHGTSISTSTHSVDFRRGVFVG